MKNNYKRRIRQVNYALKLLRKRNEDARAGTDQNLLQKCIRRLKQMKSDLQLFKPNAALIKLTAKVSFLLAIFQQTSAQAQVYSAPVQNPFGLNGTEKFVDLDNDGDLDLVGTYSLPGEVVTGYNYYGYYSYYTGGGHGIYFRLNTITAGEPSFGPAQVIYDEDLAGSFEFQLVDLDNDGDEDILGSQSNTFYIQNTGSGSNPSFGNYTYYPFNLIIQFPSLISEGIEVIDIEGDTDYDVAYIESDGSLTVHRNAGNPSSPIYAAPSSNPYGLSNFTYETRFIFEDLDGDNDLDLFAGNNDQILYYQNIGAPILPEFTTSVAAPFNLNLNDNFHSGMFSDFDQDGDKDWLGNDDFGNILINQNTGSATNPQMTITQVNPFGLEASAYPGRIVNVDLDNDNDLDLFVMSEFGVTYFENQADLLGLVSQDKIQTVSIFPNPGKDQVQIDLSTNATLKGVQVYDLSGKRLLSTDEKQIDLSSLVAGTYLITVETNLGTNHFSWVKI